MDPESSALVLSWLCLVQAARHREEQNTEAFLKGGQLYFRTTRDIRQEEELLVWYDQELSHLLGFTDISTRGQNEGEREIDTWESAIEIQLFVTILIFIMLISTYRLTNVTDLVWLF